MSELNTKYQVLHKVCRLCLTAGTASIDIHSFSSQFELIISEFIMKCTPVQINPEDKLPSVICNYCYLQLGVFSEFQKKAVTSQETLNLYLQKLENGNNCNVDFLRTNLSDVTNTNFIDSNDYSTDNIKYNFNNLHPHDNTLDGETEVDFKPLNIIDPLQSDIKPKILDSENKYLPNDLSVQTGINDFQQDSIAENSASEFCLTDLKNNEQATSHQNVHTKKFPKKYKVKNRIPKKGYQCDVCNKELCSKSNLIVHRRTHTGEKPYKCDVCSRGFTQKCLAMRHRRVHTGEKPYQCDVCSRHFSLSGTLIEHKRIHTGEKPYQCDVCFKTFSKTSHLNTHKRIHSGKRPYQCNVCNKTFSEINVLDNHKLKHNVKKKTYKCNVCNQSFAKKRDMAMTRHTCVYSDPNFIKLSPNQQ